MAVGQCRTPGLSIAESDEDFRRCAAGQIPTAVSVPWAKAAEDSERFHPRADLDARYGLLHTGHSVVAIRAGAITGQADRTGTTAVHFGVPEDADLDAYIASGEPLWVAAAFTLDGLGGWFIERIEGDPSNVIGLSLPLVRVLLARMGISVAALWATNAPAG